MLVVPMSTVRAAAPLELNADSHLVFADQDQAAEILGTEDDFVRQMSDVDRQLRLNSDVAIDQRAYLLFAREQARTWTDLEQESMRQAFADLQPRLAQLPSLWPRTIWLIKSSGREEGNAPHCRGNAIVWPTSSLQTPPKELAKILAHELFHILSRQSQARQTRLYQILGFSAAQSIELPESLLQRKLTNPDAPTVDCVITIEHGSENLHFTPLLLSKRAKYESLAGRSVFSELQFALLQITKKDDVWRATDRDRPDLRDPETLPRFFAQIGRNTGYIIHPEETLADNFVHLLYPKDELPDPWIVERLRERLQELP
jgi:hypothetical protein